MKKTATSATSPQKPPDVMISIRVRSDLLAEYREAAEYQGMDLSNFVRMAAKTAAGRVLKEKRRAA